MPYFTSLAKTTNKDVVRVDAIGYFFIYHGVHIFHSLQNPTLILRRTLLVQYFTQINI